MAILIFSLQIGARLFAVFLFIVPHNKVFGNVSHWFNHIILQSITLLLKNVLPSIGVSSMTNYSFRSVFRLQVLLAGCIIRRPKILLTWLISHCPWLIAYLSRSEFWYVMVAFRPWDCCQSLYRHCNRDTIFVDHDCMRLHNNDVKGYGPALLKLVINGCCHFFGRVSTTS